MDKAALRKALLARRMAVPAEEAREAAERLAGNWQLITDNSVIAGYMPMRGELSPLPLLARLRAEGATTLLPCVVAPESPLVFRRWEEGDSLISGAYGVQELPPTSAQIRPSVVLVPLLGFDQQGNRLGYGGGYYDRTLAELRAAGNVQAIGIAYDSQECASIPHAPHDARLDFIATPSTIHTVL
jgi:5-formyltetrahydrofolate cyclo-ligase